ncbi:MAG: TIM-barrel domain-containing protein [Planctomycetaceae bacterium]|nr:hypothetical protein [Planctomycetaceae bacterium]
MANLKERISIVDGALVHRQGSEILQIEPWGGDSLRVRATVGPEILPTPWALTGPAGEPAARGRAQIEVTDAAAVIRNGKISARISDIYTQSGYLQFFRRGSDGAEKCLLSEQDYVVWAHNPTTRVYRPRGEGLCHSEVHFAPRQGERFYGMGLQATGTLDLKGCVIDLYQRHVKHTVPFLVSSEGYGLLWNNPSVGRVELGHNLTRWVSHGCRQIDYFICTGDSCADIMHRYADATGHAPPLPAWAAGLWQCKLRYASQAEFLAVAREFKRRGLPLSVLVIDFLHWTHTGDWALDPQAWPDVPALVRELNDLGVRIMISPWTLVHPMSRNWQPMKEAGLFTGSTAGRCDTVCFGGVNGEDNWMHQYDPTNPAAAAYLWDKWKKNYVDQGIRTFWLDPCDDLHEIADYEAVQFHIGPGVEVHNYFPVAHQKNVCQGLHAAGEKDVVTICRSSWAGSQRWGAAPAAHDIMSSFEHLRTYMKAALNMAMSGIVWHASEIGGFITPDPDSDYFRELIVRWYQYGVFTPIFRTHGCRPHNEPWSFGEQACRCISDAILLRERLKPYIMAQMDLASTHGAPPQRPLFFDFPDDPRACQIEDQFMFGPDILVAPILDYGRRQRQVYLPAGATWTNAWTGAVYPGSETVTVDAPIESIPVFTRDKSQWIPPSEP